MMIPSIDIQQGTTVQLVGGVRKALDAGPPMQIAQRFAVAGELAVIDLDAAMGVGNNAALIEPVVASFPCRVGGGIRTLEAAVRWLDAGASKIILGTAATPELLGQLPKERVIAAVDGRNGNVVVNGWQSEAGASVLGRIRELRPYVGGFLVTFVEREGRMQGIDLRAVREVIEAAEGVRVTVAGGVSTVDELASIDEMGAEAQVGMALYTGAFSLADGLAAPLKSDRPDGLWPTVVVDRRGLALGLAWSNRESLNLAVERRQGIYWSRKRGLWVKGQSSGSTQELLRVDLDCDRDALRFTVRQQGTGFCHTGRWSCWGDDSGLSALAATLKRRVSQAPPGSYTRRLLDDPELLRSKLIEEAGELADAPPDSAALEAADLLYFALVALARSGGTLEQMEAELDRRSRKVTRRPGNAKTRPGGES